MYRREQFRGTYNPKSGYLHGTRDLPEGGRMHVAAQCNTDGNGEPLRITRAPSFWERVRERLKRLA